MARDDGWPSWECVYLLHPNGTSGVAAVTVEIETESVRVGPVGFNRGGQMVGALESGG
ncbi:hypothetical protein BDB13_1381 [Rhodococcus sp. OK302]|nr:hypothetical protein BDB13_1381 [Rhodococcus sp. OK302]